MSVDTKKAHEGAVSSILDSDLVMVSASNGGLKPISFSNLMNAIVGGINTNRITNLIVENSEWIRVAKAGYLTFGGILTICHEWNTGRAVPLVVFVNGSALNPDGFNACQMTTGSFYNYMNLSPTNSSLSFMALRFVKEGNDVFVEVKFKPNAKTKAIYVSLAGKMGNITLLDATISTASASNVLKTIEFSGGGITSCQSASYGLQCEKGGAHECRDYSADRQTSERYNDGCISGKRLADGHGCRSTSRMLRCERHSSQHSRGNRDVRDICGASKYILSPSNISNFFKKDVFENEKAIFDLEGDSNSKYRIIVTKRRKEVAL